MLKIVVACGSGIATSETVVGTVKSFLEEHAVKGVEVEATDFKQLPSVLPNYDIYVWLAKPTPEIHAICKKEGIPEVNGIDILTGSKGSQTYQELVNAMMNLKSKS